VTTEKGGIGYESITSLKGVEQLDLLDANNTIILARTDAGVLNLDVVACCLSTVEGVRMRTSRARSSGRALSLCGVQRRQHRGAAGAAAHPPQHETPRPTIDVVGVPAAAMTELAALDHATRGRPSSEYRSARIRRRWLASTRFEGGRVRFTPMFPLDHGRQYQVTFTAPGATPITSAVGLPAKDTTPKTKVAQVFPTSEVVPENQLRMYIHFSAPMGSRGGLDFVHLLDEAGREVKDPFLPLDADFWNDDRTRYTVFFDPGRQKRGIAPIADMGRSLTAGKSYTLVVDAEWRDGEGLPLKQPYRRTFKVGPPDEKPLDPQSWKIDAPAAGTSAPLTVTFPEPLDHGLLLRALGVLAAGQTARRRRHRRWKRADVGVHARRTVEGRQHNLVAFAMLEDLAGNRIGRAFEVDQFDRTDKSANPRKR
jgi:hypothetical protein